MANYIYWVTKMIKNNLGRLIDESPYKREYIQKYVGVSRGTLTNWITGKSYPTVPHLLKLAKILNVDINKIYYLEDEQ